MVDEAELRGNARSRTTNQCKKVKSYKATQEGQELRSNVIK